MKIAASDLGSWDFCPRQVYFRRVLGIKPEKKEVMVKGTVKHKVFEEMVKSHKDQGRFELNGIIEKVISEYSKDFGEFGTDIDDFREELKQSFGILNDRIIKDEFLMPHFCEKWLESEELGLKAKVDVIFNDSGEWIVGDLKTNASDFPGTRMQIGAGAMLFEKEADAKINRMKVISHSDWNEKEVELTGELRERIICTRDDIRNMIESGEMPPAHSNPKKCTNCEFREGRCSDARPRGNVVQRTIFSFQ